MATILITGGSRGLGRSAAHHLAGRGNDIVLTYRTGAAEAAAAVTDIASQGVRGAALPLDVGAPESFDAFAQALEDVLASWDVERLDGLINNAGIGLHRSFTETRAADLDMLFAIHFKGPFLLTQRLLPLIADGGAVLNVSSGLARFAMPGFAAYGAMKAGVETLTRYQAKELGARGIRVNSIAPGAIETDFGGGAVRDDRAVNATVAAATALGRAGLPDDIGRAMAMLLSADAGWITGQRIEVSGGMFL